MLKKKEGGVENRRVLPEIMGGGRCDDKGKVQESIWGGQNCSVICSGGYMNLFHVLKPLKLNIIRKRKLYCFILNYIGGLYFYWTVLV